MVHYGARSRPSALALEEALSERGYNGPEINFGYGIATHGLNSPYAIQKATNKRVMRELFAEHEVPAPQLMPEGGSRAWGYPVIGRPDKHRQGRGFWKCLNSEDTRRARIGTRRKAAATHFMEYIEIEREFRVHIVNGKSIKISQKSVVGNHRNGARFEYPSGFNHKKTLRKAARQAVEALGLDFGAVDIMWAGDRPFVAEVNSAPCLTDGSSDTLERYANAIKEAYDTDNVGLDASGSGRVPSSVNCPCGNRDCNIY